MKKLIYIILTMSIFPTFASDSVNLIESLDSEERINLEKVGDDRSQLLATSFSCPATPFYAQELCQVDPNGGSKGKVRMKFYCANGRLVGAEFIQIYITTGTGSVSC